MSALGHKRTYAVQYLMSALPPKADMCGALAHVCFVPIADSCSAAKVRYSISSSAIVNKFAGILRPSALLGEQIEQANEKKDNKMVNELSRDIDPESEVGQEIELVLLDLDRLCGG